MRRMISGTVKPNFWSRLLLSIIAIFALPNAQSFENQNNTENYSSKCFHSTSVRNGKSSIVKCNDKPFLNLQFPVKLKNNLKIQPHFLAECS
ncbi:DUF2547 family protein [Haemophilus influenzae biotype aegyptius]|nr:DUF2547 family protein [Haemophilus influenzae biotype aegyptius]